MGAGGLELMLQTSGAKLNFYIALLLKIELRDEKKAEDHSARNEKEDLDARARLIDFAHPRILRAIAPA
jgi:hypothetical protein